MIAGPGQFPSQALRGVRVIDFSHVIAGPFATFHLAQMGAEVTKVEKPGGSDVMRRTASGAPAFSALNGGKASCEIDIASAEGRARVLEMAGGADVMVDNYRPGVLARHGLGYDAVRAVNPRIIYCAISGYGHGSAAHAGRGAYDHVIQALTGMMLLNGTPGEPPLKAGFPLVDAATGIIAALAIVTALRERDQHPEHPAGGGCFIDVSMWASALQLMYTFASQTLTTGNELPRVGNRGFSGSPGADTFACADGWLALGANTPAHLRQLFEVLGVPTDVWQPLLEGPAGSTGGGPSFARARDPEAFRSLLVDRLATQSAADLEQRLNAAGVPAARVRSLQEFTREAVDTGMLQPVPVGEGGARAITPGLGWRTWR